MSGVIEKIEDLLPEIISVEALLNSITADEAPPPPSTPQRTLEFPDHALTPSNTKQKNTGSVLVPGKPAVYILVAPDGAPILAATTANLRRALHARLSSDIAAPGRINYGDISASVRFRTVGSAFAGSWWYYRVVRTLFPDRYKSMLAWKDAWFISINLTDEFPRFHISNHLPPPPAISVGPLATRREAKAIEDTLEDLFDLCRYYEILRQAPHGQACTYKELGKCPAPCDGSISMGVYRKRISIAAGFLMDPEGQRTAWLEEQRDLMRTAASMMDFRLAGSVKRKLEAAEDFAMEECSIVGNMDQWKHLILQRGKTPRWIAPFIAGTGWLVSLPEVAAAAAADHVDSWIESCGKDMPEQIEGVNTPRFATEEIAALVAYHKYRPNDAGLYIPMDGHIPAPVINRALDVWLHASAKPEILEVNSAQSTDAVAPHDATTP
jgi:hypothetical protein